ncbi:MAG: hypothetical protein MPK06_03760 [Alphaproteobacteria bacterium]|nr:hypothetical protein [Alphaproteobacteria bacterium]MDA8004038.1 hypothetical protein [Alphaproteobacteria bacterium]MDA8005642.1 hypothetical protein [Alphaproteobacteria bacterium]MDA8012589.1 hypothetical protein [Alphaproteobacteria bacterium]
MTADPATGLTAEHRAPGEVMRLARMGSAFPTRISFMRSLVRRLASGGGAVRRVLWEMDDNGYGRAVYSLSIDGRDYSLVAFSGALDSEQRTDRVIAEAWDASFVLFDGVPGADDIARLEARAPKQEAALFSERELVLSRANKSVRAFEHTVACLAEGRQPDAALVNDTGYLMRTTAVYGNGKFGVRDRSRDAAPLLTAPFRAELLAVWLIRGFSHDLVEHVAARRNPGRAVKLSPELRRHLGIGNSTGLGMAPFLVSHPTLLHRWIRAREEALLRARRLETLSAAHIALLRRLIVRARSHLGQWNVRDERQMARIFVLRREWDELAVLATDEFLALPRANERLFAFARARSPEFQELVVSLILEPCGEIIDDLADEMGSAGESALAPAMTLGELRSRLRRDYGWALEADLALPRARHQFWYVSQEKLEPRIGERASEAGAEKELPLDIVARIQSLARDLENDLDGDDNDGAVNVDSKDNNGGAVNVSVNMDDNGGGYMSKDMDNDGAVNVSKNMDDDRDNNAGGYMSKNNASKKVGGGADDIDDKNGAVNVSVNMDDNGGAVNVSDNMDNNGGGYMSKSIDNDGAVNVDDNVDGGSRPLKSQSVAEFLIRRPQHRYAVRRVQNTLAYSEIRDNLTDRHSLAIDMLRLKLAFFGATKFDPKSDRWTRITLFQGAPCAADIAEKNADDWWMPVLNNGGSGDNAGE